MDRYFIPYNEGIPVAIDIKGHRLLVVSTECDPLIEELELIGGDDLRVLDLDEDDKNTLTDLAASINGGIVVTPPGLSLSAMLESLEDELPWVH